MREEYLKNKPGWQPTSDDYLLVFKFMDDYWREVSWNLPQYANMIFAEYLEEVGIVLPEGCTFCRVRRDGHEWEFRQYPAKLYVYYKKV